MPTLSPRERTVLSLMARTTTPQTPHDLLAGWPPTYPPPASWRPVAWDMQYLSDRGLIRRLGLNRYASL